MRIINIVDSVEKINYGIWHAATANAALLAGQHIQTELWYPESKFDCLPFVKSIPLSSLSVAGLQKIAAERNLDPKTDIIITHGAWRYPTRWGARLKRKGFTWIYVPHGMLDPWALGQKRIIKLPYLHLIEKRLARKANLIKAVSIPESDALQAFFPHSLVKFIPNGISIEESHDDIKVNQPPIRYLFLSRLHAKKNVTALAAAWVASALNNNVAFELLFAGPDQGELNKLSPYLKQSVNMKYVGSVYNQEKKELMQTSTFYVLPSFSEGLPSALLEAMAHGLVPIITEECNLPEVFTQEMGVRILSNETNIKEVLERTANWDVQKIKAMSLRSKQFVSKQYSLEAVTDIQLKTFLNLH